MKVTILVDNNAIPDFYAEWGLSIHITDGDKQILFDTGSSDLFIKNAERIGIDLLDLDYVVLSHGHYDHTWGLDSLIRLYSANGIPKAERAELVAHPLVFAPKIASDGSELGMMISEETASRHLKLKLSKDPVWLTDRLVYLGEIPRVNCYENQCSIGQTLCSGQWIPDKLLDDSALVYKSRDGLVIITGCSHSGICNITEYAKVVCSDNRVLDIIGGFHLLDPAPEQLQGTLKYMEVLKPSTLHACHCTDLPSKFALARVVDIQEMGVGIQLKYS